MDSKAVQALTIFSGKREEFKEWNDKLINQFSCLYDRSREFFLKLTKQMNQCRQHPDDLEVGECYPTDPDELIAWTEAFPRFEEDLYCILMDRLSGEAHTKVASVPPGQGISAYVKVYLWYSGTSGMALQERASMVMHPKVPKSDEEISSVLEQWLTDCRKWRSTGMSTNFRLH